MIFRGQTDGVVCLLLVRVLFSSWSTEHRYVTSKAQHGTLHTSISTHKAFIPIDWKPAPKPTLCPVLFWQHRIQFRSLLRFIHLSPLASELVRITSAISIYLIGPSVTAAVWSRVLHTPTPPRFWHLMTSCPTSTMWENSVFPICIPSASYFISPQPCSGSQISLGYISFHVHPFQFVLRSQPHSTALFCAKASNIWLCFYILYTDMPLKISSSWAG